MATPGRRIDDHTRQQIQRLRANGVSVRETAKRAMVSTRTVQAYAKTTGHNLPS